MSAPPPPVALGHAAVFVRPFRARGRTQITAIVKATFQILPNGPMKPLRPLPIVTADVRASASPRAPLIAASEVAPYLVNADVLLAGHACARGSQPAPLVPVRLCIGLGTKVLLDKTLHAYGDRSGGGRGAPQPFLTMPLGYERALADADNPAGVDPRTGVAPNIINPEQSNRSAGFGPIAAPWPSRARRLKDADPRAVQAPWPIVPDGFDWAFYQAAPRDQQPPYLEGNERLLLEGLHADYPRLEASLPGPAAEARLQLPGARKPQSLPLVLDMLVIDADRWICSLVWRASAPLPSDEALAAAQVTARVALPGEDFPWDAPAAAGLPLRSERPPAQLSPLEQRQISAPPPVASGLPFRSERPPAQPSPLEQRQIAAPPPAQAQQPPPRRSEAIPLDGTVALHPGEALAAPSLPFQSPAAPAALPRKAVQRETLAMPAYPGPQPGDSLRGGLPFASPLSPHAPPPPETLDDDSTAGTGLPFIAASAMQSAPPARSSAALPQALPFAPPAAAPPQALPFAPPVAAMPSPPFVPPPAAAAAAPFVPVQVTAPPAVAFNASPAPPPPAVPERASPWASGAPSYAIAPPSYAVSPPPAAPLPAIAKPVAAAPAPRPARAPRRRLQPGERPPPSEPLVPARRRRPSRVAADGLGASFLRSATGAEPAQV